MSLVLDASLTLSWYFADARTLGANSVLDLVAAHSAVVPGLWRLEVANGLQMAMRRGRVDAAHRDAALAQLERLRSEIDAQTDRHTWAASVRLADRFQLTLYDAAYLELAQRRARGAGEPGPGVAGGGRGAWVGPAGGRR